MTVAGPETLSDPNPDRTLCAVIHEDSANLLHP